MDNNLNKDERVKNEKSNKKDRSTSSWIISVFFITFILSLFFSSISTRAIYDLSIGQAFIVLIIVMLIGITFDAISIAVTVADEEEFHAKATKKVPGSKTSVKLIRNSSKVANFCADVIGDICGILSGAIGALIGIKIANSFELIFNVEYIIGALIAAITVAGKAIGKDIAKRNATKIVHVAAKVLNFLHLN